MGYSDILKWWINQEQLPVPVATRITQISEDITELWQYQLPGNGEQWLEGPRNIPLSKITHAQGETNQGSGTRYPCKCL